MDPDEGVSSTLAEARTAPDLAPDPVEASEDAQPFLRRLVAPLLLFAIGGLLLALVLPGRLASSAELVGLYLVTPLGQEAWLAAAKAAFHLPLWYGATLLLWVSAVQVLLFGYAIHVEHVLVRLPRLGKKVRRLEDRVRRGKRAKAGVATALFLLVATPFHSGGAIVASLTGRALGLDSRTTVGIVLGGVTVRFVVALAIVAGVFEALGWT